MHTHMTSWHHDTHDIMMMPMHTHMTSWHHDIMTHMTSWWWQCIHTAELSEDGGHPAISGGAEFAPGIWRQRLQTVRRRSILRIATDAQDDAAWSPRRLLFWNEWILIFKKKFLWSPCFPGHMSGSKDPWHSNPTAKNHIVVNFHDPSHTLNFVTYHAPIQEILATKWDKMVPSKERVTWQENLRRRFRPSLLMAGRAEAGQRLINFSPEKLIEL